MILMDTSVIVDALDKSQENHLWAKKQIKDAVATEGGGISVVALAELCAWNRNPADVEPEIKRLGLTVQDVRHGLPALCHSATQLRRRPITQNAVAGFLHRRAS